MNKVYYSTVIDQPAEQVWSVIRDFNSYPVWVEGIDESHNREGNRVTPSAPSEISRAVTLASANACWSIPTLSGLTRSSHANLSAR